MLKRITIKSENEFIYCDVFDKELSFIANGKRYTVNKNDFLKLIGVKECVETKR